MEIARDLAVPQQQPEPARLGAVVEEELGPIDEDVELPEAKGRRGGEPRRERGGRGRGEGFLEELEEDSEDPDPAGEGPGVAALGQGRVSGDVGGEGGEGVEEGGAREVTGNEVRAGEGRSPPAEGEEGEGGCHGGGGEGTRTALRDRIPRSISF